MASSEWRVVDRVKRSTLPLFATPYSPFAPLGKLKAMRPQGTGKVVSTSAQSARRSPRIATGTLMKSRIWLYAVLISLLPATARAVDISGVPKIREGDQLQIGNTRI